MSKLTFVTAFIDISSTQQSFHWRFEKFKEVAATGIHICIYISAIFEKVIEDMTREYENIKIMKVLEMEDLWCYKTAKTIEYKLPENRNPAKDTANYMLLMNSKAELLYDAIQTNPFESTHFAWLDFNIAYIFKNPRTVDFLKQLAVLPFSEKTLIIPGCWGAVKREKRQEILKGICWRFCGGFLLGDKDSISELFTIYLDCFENFLKKNKRLVWEVNFWAWIESKGFWRPTWYKGDHNDSILDIPACSCYNSLLKMEGARTLEYEYPKIDGFEASSACYLYHLGNHVLNTRYVNYKILESGFYSFEDASSSRIVTKNMASVLNSDMVPMYYIEMKENTARLQSYSDDIVGLEDIRLYNYGNIIRFIGTSVNYAENKINQMVVGNYDPFTQSYENCMVVLSNNAEKNWIPVVVDGKEYFIYKWSPMEIGVINPATNRLEIVKTIDMAGVKWFDKIRGSTVFTEVGEFLIGVVHFSEDEFPRKYYHILVALERNTLQPLRYSNHFVFRNIGIEFCIGFTILNGNYLFWTSKNDREPLTLIVPIQKIPFVYDF